MKIIKKNIRLAVLASFFILQFGCTEHPFGNKTISLPNQKISGTVLLKDGFDSHGVYVWLEGFDLGTSVQQDRTFQISLPPRHLQVSPGGVTGAFRVYFYMANYYLTSKNVVTKRGEFLYAHGDLDRKGMLKYPIKLEKFLHIKTEITPNSINRNLAQPLSININLKAIDDPVNVFLRYKEAGLYSPIIFKKINSDEFSVFNTKIVGGSDNEFIQVDEKPVIRSLIFELSPDQNLTPGKYRIIPYLLIQHQTVPAKLLESLGQELEQIQGDYLNIPIQVRSDTLTVF